MSKIKSESQDKDEKIRLLELQLQKQANPGSAQQSIDLKQKAIHRESIEQNVAIDKI